MTLRAATSRISAVVASHPGYQLADAQMNYRPILDKEGVDIVPGCAIQVMEVHDRYGTAQLLEGIVLQMEAGAGVILSLLKPAYRHCAGRMTRFGVGDSLYARLPAREAVDGSLICTENDGGIYGGPSRWAKVISPTTAGAA